MSVPDSLAGRARAAILATEPADKIALTHAAAKLWRAGSLPLGGAGAPDRPGRPQKPPLVPPNQVKRRTISAHPRGRIALLHALAHIELNAIDLAWDIIARFADQDLPTGFIDDWVTVADDEARHFRLLADRLTALDAAYGDLPAPDGLWEAAQATAHDVMARLAVVPMVLEARGLDVTPATIARLREIGDGDSADALEVIYNDEITHVAAGHRWFVWLAARRGLDPQPHWRHLVATHFRGVPKPPFNHAARQAAGFDPALWLPGT